ncbi:MAG: alpha/beta hydrolase [Arenimonas sp.]
MTLFDQNRFPDWQPDILSGFEQMILPGTFDSDGPIDTVLVRRRCDTATTAAVLYVHGFIDYFFQTHLADFYNAQGLNFYALDLRRHGRSLRPGQISNFTKNVDEYLQDIDCAIAFMQQSEKMDWLLLNGHSTGGLVAALYGHRGLHRKRVNAIFLNSPFLDMNLPAWQASTIEPVLSWLGRWLPGLRYPGISPIYAESIHVDHHGQWQFRTDWKPIAGFPVYAGWFRAIHRAQTEIAKGLNISCPCLVLHARKSARVTKWDETIFTSDIVLNVTDIKKLSPGLGSLVEIHAIENGIHDLVLSGEAVRTEVWRQLSDWLVRTSSVVKSSDALDNPC